MGEGDGPEWTRNQGALMLRGLLDRVSVGGQSTMKRKEDPADPGAHQRNLQFVGVNGG